MNTAQSISVSRNGNGASTGPAPGLSRVSNTFEPHRLIRASALQTMLSTVNPNRDNRWILETEQPLLIDAGVDETGADPDRQVRLLAYYNRTVGPTRRGLVLALHGWEGCSHSNYNLITANTLLNAGYDVVRLNMRDHGPGIQLDPHALNKGVFLGTLINEVIEAGHQIARLAEGRPYYIIGASMGGNFALRMARSHTDRPFLNLKRVVVFSPALDPGRSTKAIDEKPPYHLYFRRRWARSLRRKQELFPDSFDFDDVLQIPSIYDMTDALVRQSDQHATVEEYFEKYSVKGDALSNLSVPTTVITALDDAVIPVVDFYGLAPHPLLDVRIERYGGHVGWIDIFPFRHCLPEMMMEILQTEEA